MTTIIYAHPYDKSFNHAILEEVKSKLISSGRNYKVIDLYKEKFNPALDADSLKLFSKGETADPLAREYLAQLLKTDEIIFIFPIWWSTMPAIVDGFIDKVMLEGKAYKYDETGKLIPAEININRTIIISTSEAPSHVFSSFFTEYFKNNVLETVGMKNL